MAMDLITLRNIFDINLSSNIGPSKTQLVNALANSLFIYKSNLIVTSVNVGTLGAGVGTGFGFPISPTLIPTMISFFVANGLIGISSPKLALEISNGIIQAFGVSQISTISAGVGVGTGVSSITPNSLISVPVFTSSFISSGISGIFSFQLANAIALSLDTTLPLTVSPLIIAGPPSPLPGSGGGIGTIF